MKDGLKIETAAGVVARDLVRQHFEKFSFTIRRSRPAGQAVVAAYIDALAGAMALTIASGHGSLDEVTTATLASLRDAVARDLRHLKLSI